ncbi:MAG: hypothetical protein IPJ30_17325 [Acidobacteria bacterium]|nr:hypothetical protein [Acidobacteriota bacterium]
MLAKRLAAPTSGRRQTKETKTTGSEDDLEWTKALSSTPPDPGEAPEVCRAAAVPAGLVEPEEGYGNAAHVGEEKQKRFPQFPTIAWKSQKRLSTFPATAAGYKSLKTKRQRQINSPGQQHRHCPE